MKSFPKGFSTLNFNLVEYIKESIGFNNSKGTKDYKCLWDLCNKLTQTQNFNCVKQRDLIFQETYNISRKG